MKQFISKLVILAMVAIVAVSCTKSLPENPNNGAVLFVGEISSTSRVGFVDKDADGITPTWELEDQFTLYDADGKVDNFKCTDAESGKFVSVTSTTQLVNNTKYTAIYPASTETTLDAAKDAIDPSVQNGDQINNLDNSLYMLSTFTYATGVSTKVSFVHQMAVMTFKFDKDATHTPKKLVFENGTDVYTVNYTTGNENSLETVGDVYTSHIMINPCVATSRTLKFSLYDTSNELYKIHKITSEKAYEAGRRYTASVSEYNQMFSGGTGDEATPYLISNESDLRELSDRVSGTYTGVDGVNNFNGKFFKMTDNVDLGGMGADGSTTTPAKAFNAIGLTSEEYVDWGEGPMLVINKYKFSGAFDGNGKTVSGLYINKPGKDYQALFGLVEGMGAVIKNLTVEGEVTGDNYVSGVVGKMTEGTVVNCHNGVKVTAMDDYVGGVVGSATSVNVANCYNSATISTYGSLAKIGGIVGYFFNYDNYVITNCYNSGAVMATGSNAYIGGILGGGDVVPANCYWASDATATDALYGFGSTSSDTGAEPMTIANMQHIDFATTLNNNAAAYNDTTPAIKACGWKVVAEGFPTFDFTRTPAL